MDSIYRIINEIFNFNIYYSPEKHGLEIVAAYNFNSGDWEYDLRVFWRDRNGSIFTARDSGNSLATPFEYYKNKAALERIDSIKQFKHEMIEEVDMDNYNGDSRTYIRGQLLKVEDLLKQVNKKSWQRK